MKRGNSKVIFIQDTRALVNRARLMTMKQLRYQYELRAEMERIRTAMAAEDLHEPPALLH